MLILKTVAIIKNVLKNLRGVKLATKIFVLIALRVSGMIQTLKNALNVLIIALIVQLQPALNAKKDIC